MPDYLCVTTCKCPSVKNTSSRIPALILFMPSAGKGDISCRRWQILPAMPARNAIYGLPKFLSGIYSHTYAFCFFSRLPIRSSTFRSNAEMARWLLFKQVLRNQRMPRTPSREKTKKKSEHPPRMMQCERVRGEWNEALRRLRIQHPEPNVPRFIISTPKGTRRCPALHVLVQAPLRSYSPFPFVV